MARSEQPPNQLTHITAGELSMTPNQKAIDAQAPRVAAAEVALVALGFGAATTVIAPASGSK
jgi:hypothetical protein